MTEIKMAILYLSILFAVIGQLRGASINQYQPSLITSASIIEKPNHGGDSHQGINEKLKIRHIRASGDKGYFHDEYYVDTDYAGYNKEGAAVGYQDPDDDFPTVVW
ncbi:uncharacterized protein LOC126739183 [Anthonomus grandis grandis]|uniref:uncharacterized protein LOC126739183 n=1 Tax=Anthonomus grandis grandis TaxID=2921223 RepID=UPI002166BA16|nr:uncharacterized protein LOC126739183 [Anthonomus grandis grandis]